VKILLDENVPLPLYHRLRAAGFDAEHIIALGMRGLPDAAIRQRLLEEDIVFLTHDMEFEDLPPTIRSQVVISRVPQSLPIGRRVEICFAARGPFLDSPPAGRLFELLDSGEIASCKVREN